MSKVTQVHRATGSFELNFDGLPQELIDQLDELGHVVVTQVREDGPSVGDGLLTASRYVGVVIGRRKEKTGSEFTLTGDGMAWWLGTEDKAGAVYETAKTYSGATFSAVVTDLLPPAITPGTLTNTGLPTYTGTQQYQSPREALDYVCDTVGAEWRVNGDGTLDAGPASAVFASGRALIVRRAADAGEDMTLRAFPGPAQTDRDLEDFTTRVVVLGEVDGTSVVQGSWDISGGLNPYKDIHGNAVQLTRLVSESSTEGVNADARAAAIGAQYSGPQRAITLDTSDYDMRGVIEVGDTVWIHDPEAGLEDPANEVQFRGQRLNPVAEQVTTISWPVTDGMGVYYRSRLGAWLDLSRWLVPSGDTTSVEVGKNKRDLVSSASSPVGRIPTPDTSIPGVVAFVTPFKASTYQRGDTGESKAQVQVKWSALLTNTDASAFIDGSHYEIRYRPSADPLYPATYSQAAAAGTYSSLGTWGTPISQTFSDYQTAYAPIDATTALIAELPPGTPIEFGIRALDSATPPNAGAWSATYTQYTPVDVDPPADPAAPVVAGSKIAILVKHYLGASTGGTFNLALDLARLDVHLGATSTFTVDNRPLEEGGTLIGKIVATRAQILGQIPVLGTFAVDTTTQVWVKVVAVDVAGNPSGSSAAAAVTAELIDSQWVSDLTADKVTSGTMVGSYIVGGEFTTAPSGQRVRFGFDGIEAYLSDGVTKFVDVDIAAQTVTVVGEFSTAFSGQRIRINPGSALPDTIAIYPSGGGDFGRIMARTAPGDGSAAILIDGGAASGTARGRLGCYKGEAFISYVTSDTGGDSSAGFSRTAVSCSSDVVSLWAQNSIAFDKYSGSSPITAAHAFVFWSAGTSSSTCPMFGSSGSNAAVKLDNSTVCATFADGAAFTGMKATAFTPSSTQESKTDIVDVRQILDPRTPFRAARSKGWKYKTDVDRWGDAAPMKFGPVAEDLPPELVYMTPKADGSGLEPSVDLISQIGMLWARENQREDEEIVSTSAVAIVPPTTVIAAGKTIEIPVVWESSPPAAPTGGFATINSGLVWAGKVTAWLKAGSTTATGAVVVFKNISANPITVLAVAAGSVSASVVGLGLYSPPYVPPPAAPEEP